MQTKIEAGKIATRAGTHMVIASGRVPHALRAIAEGAACTWFLTAANPVTARKKWIAGSLEPKGILTIDAGAVAALRSGKSLLPAGVIRVDGQFARGDAVIIRGPGDEMAAVAAYDAEDADRIKAAHRPIFQRSWFRRPHRMVHRDHWRWEHFRANGLAGRRTAWFPRRPIRVRVGIAKPKGPKWGSSEGGKQGGKRKSWCPQPKKQKRRPWNRGGPGSFAGWVRGWGAGGTPPGVFIQPGEPSVVPSGLIFFFEPGGGRPGRGRRRRHGISSAPPNRRASPPCDHREISR
jgi:hypothetical protein